MQDASDGMPLMFGAQPTRGFAVSHLVPSGAARDRPHRMKGAGIAFGEYRVYVAGVARDLFCADAGQNGRVIVGSRGEV